MEIKYCKVCEKKIEYNPTQRIANYCSQICLHIDQKKRIKGKCNFCNKTIDIIQFEYKKYKYHFCNAECHNKWQSRNKVELHCIICNKTYLVSKTRSKSKTCSERCKGTYSCLQQSKKRGLNKLEKAGYKIIDSLNVKYEKQYLCCNFLVDTYLPDYKIVIQWDGKYWHSLSRVKNRDKLQDAYMKKMGYLIFRFDESIVYNESNEVRKVINEGIQSRS